MSAACNRCRYWHEDVAHRDPADSDWGFGSCRRQPPVIVDSIVRKLMPKPRFGEQVDPDMDVVELCPATRFPATHSSEWCGSFHRRRADPLNENLPAGDL